MFFVQNHHYTFFESTTLINVNMVHFKIIDARRPIELKYVVIVNRSLAENFVNVGCFWDIFCAYKCYFCGHLCKHMVRYILTTIQATSNGSNGASYQ